MKYIQQYLREEQNVAEANPEIVSRIEEIMKAARTSPAVERFKIKVLDDTQKKEFIDDQDKFDMFSITVYGNGSLGCCR